MNRLVIVGNGFDLAHGLPTGYCDFINDFWKNLKSNYQDPRIIDILYINPSYNGIFGTDQIKSYKDFEKNIKEYCLGHGFRYNDRFQTVTDSSYNETLFKFENDFFRVISNKNNIQNWVDIENEYYKLLKECLKEEDNAKVKKLNGEFECVRRLLEDYLAKNVSQNFDFEKVNEKVDDILSFFEIKPKFLQLEDPLYNNYMKEFSNKDFSDLIEFDNQIIDFNNRGMLADHLKTGNVLETNLFLNFNYTQTVDAYINAIGERKFFGISYEIQIHGKLNDIDNLVNFGFGDEMDDDYKTIENKDDNEYLKNIKSFQYFQNSNYRNMLDFIDRDKFQVYIMGHSCGLSDRILLNKIFEHHNCRSIKVFYYKKGEWDNYTEIVQNISRHFNKKEMMREKIVNKSLCQPLPQDIRFAKRGNS